jgi:hypothetical protein
LVSDVFRGVYRQAGRLTPLLPAFKNSPIDRLAKGSDDLIQPFRSRRDQNSFERRKLFSTRLLTTML